MKILVTFGELGPFPGYRDALSINTCLHKVDTSLNVAVLENPHTVLDNLAKIAFTSMLLKGCRAAW